MPKKGLGFRVWTNIVDISKNLSMARQDDPTFLSRLLLDRRGMRGIGLGFGALGLRVAKPIMDG